MMGMPIPSTRRTPDSEEAVATSEDLYDQIDETEAHHEPFSLEGPLQHFFLNAEQDQVVAVYDGVAVDVSDIQQDVNQFVFQQRAFEALFEPEEKIVHAVSLPVHDETLSIPVSLDLYLEAPQLHTAHVRSFDPDPEDLRQIIEIRYEATSRLLLDAGLQVDTVSQKDATASFFRGLSSFFLTRWGAVRHQPPPEEPNKGPPDGPPAGEFVTITTDQDRQLILHTRGYFLSTRSFFAYSTPGRRFVAHGSYLFGLQTSNGPRFLDVLFDVPPHTEIYLPPP